ncbi:MAG: ABC transporter permease [Candidatus Manganitrophus sp.]|nr:ABC transporter permease [Candidatus Manganitrophus sp.]
MEKESTFGSLLRHEVDLYRSNPARLLITGLMMIIVILALYRGGAIFHHRAESIHEAQAAAEGEWAKFKPEQWLNAGVGSGKWIYQPPLPSSMLMDGISRNQTAGLRVRVGLAPAHRTELTDGQQAWNPQVSRFGSLDLGFVLTVLAPLWVILLTFDAVSGEKERGTLRLLFSYPVDRKSYLNAKAFGLLIWVVVPISIAFFIGFLVNGFSGHFQNGFIHPMRLILFASDRFSLSGVLGDGRSLGLRPQHRFPAKPDAAPSGLGRFHIFYSANRDDRGGPTSSQGDEDGDRYREAGPPGRGAKNPR